VKPAAAIEGDKERVKALTNRQDACRGAVSRSFSPSRFFMAACGAAFARRFATPRGRRLNTFLTTQTGDP